MVVLLGFGVKENNYLGKGIKLDTNFTINEDSLKGKIFCNKSKL